MLHTLKLNQFKSTPLKLANIYRVKVLLLLKRYLDSPSSYFQKAKHKRDIGKHIQEPSVYIHSSTGPCDVKVIPFRI